MKADYKAALGSRRFGGIGDPAATDGKPPAERRRAARDQGIHGERSLSVDLIKQMGWLPVGIVLIVATVIAGVLLKVTSPKKKNMKDLSDREKWELYGIGQGPRPGDDVEEYWRDFELLKQGKGRDDEYFKDDQV